MRKYLQIAIDGPVGSGKSTVAELVAERLGWLYVYTGAMYRAAALLAKRKEVGWNSGEDVARLVESAEIEIKKPEGSEKDGRVVTLILNGEDVSQEIMKEEFGEGASIIGIHREVREVLVRKQQEIASKQNVVMEGRDITTRVLPGAQLKVYLTADEEERARRRYAQLVDRRQQVTYKDVLRDLKLRDKRDKNREIDPLKVAEGAWVLDTTNLTIDQVTMEIVSKINGQDFENK
jgi:cytidylate kinase